jgi:hypothetical protein
MDRVQGSGSQGLCTFIKLQLLAFGSMAQIDLAEGVFPILISSVDRLMGGQDLKLAKGYFASNLSRLLGDGWWGAAHRPLAACPQTRGSVEGGGGRPWRTQRYGPSNWMKFYPTRPWQRGESIWLNWRWQRSVMEVGDVARCLRCTSGGGEGQDGVMKLLG